MKTSCKKNVSPLKASGSLQSCTIPPNMKLFRASCANETGYVLRSFYWEGFISSAFRSPLHCLTAFSLFLLVQTRHWSLPKYKTICGWNKYELSLDCWQNIVDGTVIFKIQIWFRIHFLYAWMTAKNNYRLFSVRFSAHSYFFWNCSPSKALKAFMSCRFIYRFASWIKWLSGIDILSISILDISLV